MHIRNTVLSFFVAVSFARSAEPDNSWSKEPPEKWPQIVLTHTAAFRDGRELKGASCFLISTPAGEVLSATAKHLLGPNGGLDPAIELADLDRSLASWFVHPRTQPETKFQLTGLATKGADIPNNDWLLLKCDSKAGKITTLTLRNTPVKLGERVHLIGVSYAEPSVSQKVYSGEVTLRSPGTDRFSFDITPHVELQGFSGAPIVDDDGLCVGVMSLWFKAYKKDGLYTEAGGEDATSALLLLKAEKK